MIIHIITKKNLPLYFPRVSMKNFWPWHFRRSDRKSKNNLTTNKVLIKTFSKLLSYRHISGPSLILKCARVVEIQNTGNTFVSYS